MKEALLIVSGRSLTLQRPQTPHIGLGLHCCTWVFVAARGLSLIVLIKDYSLIAVHELLTAVASLAAEHGLRCTGTSVVVQGLSCPVACSVFLTRVQTMSPALAGKF